MFNKLTNTLALEEKFCEIIVLNFQHFSLSVLKIKMWALRDGIHKMLCRIANMKDPDQTASSKAV